MNERIVFLDIDGVLVNPESMQMPRVRRVERSHHRLHPDCVAALNRITDTTRARIVISSTWRMYGLTFMRRVLYDAGVLGFVIGVTPKLLTECGSIVLSATRGDEIQEWLRKDGAKLGVDSFVILDDDSDMGALSDRLIQTNFHTGLTLHDAERAIDVLRTPLQQEAA